MATSKDKKNQKDTTQEHDDIVAFVPGTSMIDISEIRRAQENMDAEIDDEEELSLDDEAALILDEMANDPELKKDVLEGYTEKESDQDLASIAEKVAIHTQEQIAAYEKLSLQIGDELNIENLAMIAEDKLLESMIAKEVAKEIEEASQPKKSKKAKKEELKATQADTLTDFDDADAVETEEMSEQDAELKAALPQLDENGNYNTDDLQSCISALLFYSDRPLSLKKIKEMLEMPEAEDESILRAINGLKDEFTKLSHGFEIADIAHGYQLRTKITRAPLLRKLAKVQVQRLSRGAMETLTIVSYKQPCTKDDIDQVRGVDSSHFIRTLLDRHLIEVSGRSEAAGRPMIYETTSNFLEVFGMMDLKGLPPLHEIEAMVPQLAAQAEGEEDPRVVQMRKMVHTMSIESNNLDYDAKEDDVILQEIRDRVKSIDVTTPYLARQKQLAEEGVHGADAEEILSKEFGFTRDPHNHVAPEVQTAMNLEAPMTEDVALMKAREALLSIDLDEEQNS